MSIEELRKSAITLFGKKGWVSALSSSLGVDRSTVYRWLQGVPIPGPVEAAIKSWMDVFKLTGNPPNKERNHASVSSAVKPRAGKFR